MVADQRLVGRDGPQIAEGDATRLFGGASDPTHASEPQVEAKQDRRNSLDLAATNDPVELDMGMASRIEGFRIVGCR